MAKIKLLTARQVNTLSAGFHFDGGNLYLRVRDTGSRSWMLRYKRREKCDEKVSDKVIEIGREKIGVTVKLHGFGKDKRSVWTLSNMPAPDSYVPYMPNKLSGTNGTYDGTHQENVLVEVEI